jgi:uncharacterized Zn-finger protein
MLFKILVISKEMPFDCIYCTKTYCNKSSLNHHQKTSKKCLLIQDKVSDTSFACVGCDSTFTRKCVYQNHIITCGLYIEIQLSEEYEWKLIQLEEKLQRKEEENEELRKENEKLLKENEKLLKRPQMVR